MKDFLKIQEIPGLQIIPINEKKIPIVSEWQISSAKHDLSTCYGIGLVCGKISGNIEAIDLDLKYDLTGKLFEQYKSIIHQLDANILPNLVVQKTVSGGYHFIYRCDTIQGNQKLAQRYATEAEKQSGEKIKVLLETRGEGGYIACYPTKGYELIYGSFDKIQTITQDQREILFNVAFSFNEVLKPHVHKEVKQRKQTKGLTSIEDYNDRGDVVELLENHGWKAVGRKGAKILMRRPGDTKANHSGNYDEEKKWFSVFSTSTEFESQTPYLPYAVYTVLECGGDFKLTPKKLYDLGYGDREEEIRQNHTDVPSVIDTSDDDLSFLAEPIDYDDYIDQWNAGTFPMGKTTGIDELDKYFRFKDGNFVIINGLDNVGKSTVIWYLSMLSTMLHEWPVLIFSSENKVGSIMRKLIEFYWCEPLKGMPEQKVKQAKAYIRKYFDIIKVSDKLYNYRDVLNMHEKAARKKKYRMLMIDPYNSLKVDIPAKSKQDFYNYHYEAASVMQLYGKQNDLSIYLNCHVGTQGARNVDKDGFVKPPQKSDTEMGVMFANKADDFLTIHRVTQHETEWNLSEIHVRKIKEVETGGRLTPLFKPVKLKMINHLSGFEYLGQNPVHDWHRKNNRAIPLDFTVPVKEYEIKENDNAEEGYPF